MSDECQYCEFCGKLLCPGDFMIIVKDTYYCSADCEGGRVDEDEW